MRRQPRRGIRDGKKKSQAEHAKAAGKKCWTHEENEEEEAKEEDRKRQMEEEDRVRAAEKREREEQGAEATAVAATEASAAAVARGEEEKIGDDDRPCKKCGDNQGRMVLCDTKLGDGGTCDKVYHLGCVGLDHEPAGEVRGSDFSWRSTLSCIFIPCFPYFAGLFVFASPWPVYRGKKTNRCTTYRFA